MQNEPAPEPKASAEGPAAEPKASADGAAAEPKASAERPAAEPKASADVIRSADAAAATSARAAAAWDQMEPIDVEALPASGSAEAASGSGELLLEVSGSIRKCCCFWR